jgi:hypothetical protein
MNRNIAFDFEYIKNNISLGLYEDLDVSQSPDEDDYEFFHRLSRRRTVIDGATNFALFTRYKSFLHKLVLSYFVHWHLNDNQFSDRKLKMYSFAMVREIFGVTCSIDPHYYYNEDQYIKLVTRKQRNRHKTIVYTNSIIPP